MALNAGQARELPISRSSHEIVRQTASISSTGHPGTRKAISLNRSVTEQLSIVPINPTIHGWQSRSRLSPWPWQSTKISVTRPSLRVRVS
jgi:hypothetical protein